MTTKPHRVVDDVNAFLKRRSARSSTKRETTTPDVYVKRDGRLCRSDASNFAAMQQPRPAQQPQERAEEEEQHG